MLQLVYHYPMMIPPFEMVGFSEMTKKQARAYFDWFVNEIPVRIKILMGAIEVSGVKNMEQFDMTPESLSPLWAWLKDRIKSIPKSPEEMNELRSTLPDWIFEDISDWKLDFETLAMAADVSLYFAEVFLRKYPHLQWDFKNKPKSDVYVNKPVVVGFKNAPLHPPTVVVNLCSSHVEGKNKDLLTLYEVWSKFL